MVRYNDRALIIGATGSGKSELINLLLAGTRCQRVLIDTKDEFALPGVEPVSDAAAIDWQQRTVHYRPPPTAGVDAFDELFRRLYARRNVVVAVHELGDVCEFQPNRTPAWFNAYLSKGRARGLGMLAGTQRPVQIPTRARSESDHVFMVGERLLIADDHKAVADAMGQNPRELAELIDRTQERLGGEPDDQGRTHAFVGFTRAQRKLTAYPPIPPEHRRVIDVERTLAIDNDRKAATS
jgi:energy-coupling factor transporter ATP-binding protein EcfA2